MATPTLMSSNNNPLRTGVCRSNSITPDNGLLGLTSRMRAVLTSTALPPRSGDSVVASPPVVPRWVVREETSALTHARDEEQFYSENQLDGQVKSSALALSSPFTLPAVTSCPPGAVLHHFLPQDLPTGAWQLIGHMVLADPRSSMATLQVLCSEPTINNTLCGNLRFQGEVTAERKRHLFHRYYSRSDTWVKQHFVNWTGELDWNAAYDAATTMFNEAISCARVAAEPEYRSQLGLCHNWTNIVLEPNVDVMYDVNNFRFDFHLALEHGFELVLPQLRADWLAMCRAITEQMTPEEIRYIPAVPAQPEYMNEEGQVILATAATPARWDRLRTGGENTWPLAVMTVLVRGLRQLLPFLLRYDDVELLSALRWTAVAEPAGTTNSKFTILNTFRMSTVIKNLRPNFLALRAREIEQTYGSDGLWPPNRSGGLATYLSGATTTVTTDPLQVGAQLRALVAANNDDYKTMVAELIRARMPEPRLRAFLLMPVNMVYSHSVDLVARARAQGQLPFNEHIFVNLYSLPYEHEKISAIFDSYLNSGTVVPGAWVAPNYTTNLVTRRNYNLAMRARDLAHTDAGSFETLEEAFARIAHNFVLHNLVSPNPHYLAGVYYYLGHKYQDSRLDASGISLARSQVNGIPYHSTLWTYLQWAYDINRLHDPAYRTYLAQILSSHEERWKTRDAGRLYQHYVLYWYLVSADQPTRRPAFPFRVTRGLGLLRYNITQPSDPATIYYHFPPAAYPRILIDDKQGEHGVIMMMHAHSSQPATKSAAYDTYCGVAILYPDTGYFVRASDRRPLALAEFDLQDIAWLSARLPMQPALRQARSDRPDRPNRPHCAYAPTTSVTHDLQNLVSRARAAPSASEIVPAEQTLPSALPRDLTQTTSPFPRWNHTVLPVAPQSATRSTPALGSTQAPQQQN